MADLLTAAGIGPGDVVGIALANGPEYLETFFAALKVGAVPANVNFQYGPDELTHVLDDCRAAALVHRTVDSAAVDDALARVRRSPVLTLAVGDGARPSASVAYEDALDEPGPRHPRTHVATGDDIFLLYTGGTTGLPKGVVWRTEDYYLMGWEMARPGTLPPDPEDAMRAGKRAATLFPTSPLVHGTALGLATQTLSGGGAVVLRTEPHLDAAAIWDLVERERVRTLGIVGDTFARPLLAELASTNGSRDVSSLRAVVSSGMRFSPALKRRFLDLVPGITVVDSLGSSEGMMSKSTATAASADVPRTFSAGPHLRVVTDDGRDAVAGSVDEGLLMVSGRLPVGYHNDPDATARTFREIDGVRYSVPGDRARVLADGSIELLGRGSSCINTGGEKVYPEEVERVLRDHSAVDDVAVVGLPEDHWGEMVVAVVQPTRRSPSPNDAIDLPEALAALSRAHLAGYKRPKRYVLVDELPRTVAGKPDHARLRSLAEASGGE